MPVTNEKEFMHLRVKISLAHRLQKIARRNHRRGIQTDGNLAIAEYCHKHETLSNKQDNGK